MIKKILLWVSVLVISSCNSDDAVIVYSKGIKVAEPEEIKTQGIYLLNEGNMGSNKASLDFYDYSTGFFTKNIYGEINPHIVNSLGDVGNDIKIYGNKLYAVINASNYVEVMNANTAKHIGEIKIPNCRYITFDKGFAYISSFAGPIGVNPNAQLGYVAKIDTATLQIVDKAMVGYQPEEMAIVNNKLYVANSGGYRAPKYDKTLSVIDLTTFKEIKKIEVDINLWRVRKDKNNKLWVVSRGNHLSILPKTYIINPETDEIEKKIEVEISDMSFVDNKMYYFGYVWSSSGTRSSYGIIDVDTHQIISENFIKKGVEADIMIPYAIEVNPENGNIFIADAKNYISPGELFCFDANGNLKWKAVTGDIPGHFALLWKKNN